MALFDFNITLALPREFFNAVDKLVAVIISKGNAIMNDLTQLQATVAALETKAAENNATLAGLAQAVIDLKASGDVQAGIDELTTKAQAILDSITLAEDAADEQLPATP